MPHGPGVTAVPSKHSASISRLVHRIAAITIHYLVHLTEADTSDPVSVIGLLSQHMSQQPNTRHHRVV